MQPMSRRTNLEPHETTDFVGAFLFLMDIKVLNVLVKFFCSMIRFMVYQLEDRFALNSET